MQGRKDFAFIFAKYIFLSLKSIYAWNVKQYKGSRFSLNIVRDIRLMYLQCSSLSCCYIEEIKWCIFTAALGHSSIYKYHVYILYSSRICLLYILASGVLKTRSERRKWQKCFIKMFRLNFYGIIIRRLILRSHTRARKWKRDYSRLQRKSVEITIETHTTPLVHS